MSLPSRSRPADEILAELDALKQHDVKWKDGRAFTSAYYAGPDVAALGDEAYRRFSSDNALEHRRVSEPAHDPVRRGRDGGRRSSTADRTRPGS